MRCDVISTSRERIAAARGRSGLFGVIVAAVAFPLVTSVCEAASFACSAPAAPRERVICADPELSHADEALAAAYKAALGALSDTGQEAIREGQRQWLRYTQTVCGIGRKAPAGRSSIDCLKDEYTARQKQLASAVVKRAGLVVRRVDLFKATPSSGSGSGGRYPGFNTTVASYPQIDRPRNEGEEAWNKLIFEHSRAGEAVAGTAADPEEDHDLTVDYALGTASPTLISLRLLIYDDWHGAHGTAADEQITSFIRDGRALAAEDVFHGKQGWEEALARLVLDQAAQEAQKGGYELPFAEPLQLAGEVSDPAHWLISERTLGVRFEIDGFPTSLLPRFLGARSRNTSARHCRFRPHRISRQREL
jgi:uncharacterized protein YecT (DUF1311 family)